MSVDDRSSADAHPSATTHGERPARRSWRRRAPGGALAAIGLAIGGWLMWRAIGRYSLEELRAAIAAVPPARVAAASAFCAASYLCLTLFDHLALRAAGAPLPYRRAALASFCALALAHNLSLSGVSSAAVRYRFYSRWGLDAEQIGRVVIFCGATIVLGLTTLAGLAFAWDPRTAAGMAHLPVGAIHAIAAGCLAVPLGYLALCATVRAPLRVKGYELSLPRPSLALAQIAAGAANYAFVVAALHQAIAGVSDVGYGAALVAYMAARVATSITRAPAGIGVTETVVQQLLPQHPLIGPLLVFRFVHDLVPLALASVAFTLSEARRATMTLEPRRARD